MLLPRFLEAQDHSVQITSCLLWWQGHAPSCFLEVLCVTFSLYIQLRFDTKNTPPFEVGWQFTPWCICFDAPINDSDNDGGRDNNNRALDTY